VNVDLAVLIDDQLDLPERLPGSSKKEGKPPSSKIKKKR
jgi:hypothetical protein